ncbi:hypothetical protein CRE_03412 [Caenorhabditis remanei]|uniref:Transposase Tc5 C-terminal domain-containing protein n=1 Tax=Caenorhabditis remanei TaxID=31234 RepID=E3NAL4_CAERE|nr:hypothetical protein CRE_03412 [Caenorhabditis remanei]
MRNNDEIEKVAHEFVRDCKQEMAQFPLYSVLNADQTGIQKELYGSRAHAFKGAKNVERLVQAKSSLTHSFTFLPMLFMNGTLGPKAYVKLAEPTGRIPPSRPIPAGITNLEVRAGKSHIMTKEDMCDWLKSCVSDPSLPKKLYLLLDHWPPFKDHDTIRKCAPPGYDITIRNIPPHATGLIQPLDVYFNLPWKNLLKKFTNYVINFHPEFLIAQRNNELCMVSALYHQISAREFQSFLQYPWKKSGYMDRDANEPEFTTPAEYCMGKATPEDCYISGCVELGCLKCARCQNWVCFDHLVVSQIHLCPLP